MHERQQEANRQFQRELDLVRGEMSDSIRALGSPLRELLQRRIADAGPPYRAALVLAAGYSERETDPAHRIRLGAALEMLSVALGIHQLLLDAPAAASSDQDLAPDRSFIGSTILTGDFCFSRAAQMAASTQNPTIVSIFSQALQDVSEERLRALHPAQQTDQSDGKNGREPILLRAGAVAAVELSDLPSSLLPAVHQLSSAVYTGTLDDWTSDASWDEALATLPAGHVLRWLALSEWLRTSRAD